MKIVIRQQSVGRGMLILAGLLLGSRCPDPGSRFPVAGHRASRAPRVAQALWGGDATPVRRYSGHVRPLATHGTLAKQA